MRVRNRTSHTKRHHESVAQLGLVLREVSDAAERRLYRELLTLRLSKHGGKKMQASERQHHSSRIVEDIDADGAWDDLRVLLKLKAIEPVALIEQIPAKIGRPLWKSAWSFQGEGSGPYSAAAFKLPKPVFEALRARYRCRRSAVGSIALCPNAVGA